VRLSVLRPSASLAAFACLLLAAGDAHAQEGSGALLEAFREADGETAGRIIQLAGLLTVLSLAPALLVTMTSFTRLVIALSFLRSGLGLPATPSNLVIIALSLFLTGHIMAPVFDRAWTEGVEPLMQNKVSEEAAVMLIAAPFRDFMEANTRPQELNLFEELSRTAPAAAGEEVPWRVLAPAFLISELRRAFEIGFLILLPFLVIDIVVSMLTMSMGMMMLPPTVLSLPFKVLFFVLIDGWSLLAGSLVRSFV
jgi:flagellar biosynthesis protein FliP